MNTPTIINTPTMRCPVCSADFTFNFVSRGAAAYDAVRAERERQIAKGRTPEKDDERTHPDWMACLAIVLRNEKDRGDRAVWVKVASVAIAAIQSMDRLASDEGEARICYDCDDAALEGEDHCADHAPKPLAVKCDKDANYVTVHMNDRGEYVDDDGNVHTADIGAERVSAETAQGRPLSTPWSAAAVGAVTDMLAGKVRH